ncbi:MAG: thiamine-phosphate kinase [Candidatus Omnitrophica bacterium]|nr:thiamine-phosphate kinase [Candidatus Omnitrophota bacterium]
MNEIELIALLTQSLPMNNTVVTGAGDDCAVLDLGLPGQWLLFKTDAVVAEVHFDAGARPEQIGHKAMGRCLSDIAAMAGSPVAALVTLGLPPHFDPCWVAAIYAGMKSLAQRYNVAIVGGETTTSPDRTFISISMIGTVDKSKCVLRSGARAGDAILVSGTLGGSWAGKHLEFAPRVNEARWLADHFAIHAMLDVSDGLASDLRHILNASGVGAELLARDIPISPAASQTAHGPLSAHAPLNAALTDGEDFELLFTLAGADTVRLLDAWHPQFPSLPLTCIGKITAEPGLKLRDRDQVREVTEQGYVHFA